MTQISATEESWRSCGIEPEFLTTTAAWLEEKRGMHSEAFRHFEVSGSLMRFARQDYKLGSAAFFHAVLGLEKALRMHYLTKEESLQELLRRARADSLIPDSLFKDAPAFTRPFAGGTLKKLIGTPPASRADLLVELIPKLRNEYMHGEYLLTPDFVHLARQVRVIADQLETLRGFPK